MPTLDSAMDNAKRELPSGVVTFLFTDIEDSTLLLRELGGELYSEALSEHRTKVRQAVAQHDGVEIDTQGDAFFVAFKDAGAAVAAALSAQQALADGPLAVRMGLHTGAPLTGPEGYVGEDVHLGARIAAAGHGGQILISRATREGAHDALGEIQLTDLGEHRVKGFDEPVWIFQVGGAAHPPLRTISNTNLPRPPSRFVGREAEIGAVAEAVRRGSRLVTLSGAGGSGKTRLAIEAAASLVPDFKGGVFWIGLDAIRDPALVMPTIAQVLGAKGSLAEHIGERQMLLVLDNLEQVIDAAPEVSRLLAECPALQAIVTSRELLRVNGETDYPVPVLGDAEAVALFCDRAQLDDDPAIAVLCRRLDNLPLAIELAAARTRVMTPAQILDRLSQRLDMLKGGRDSDARQQTLRATIKWSHDLLPAAEQELLARLAVFRGGWNIDAAEHVADGDIDLLQALVDKSLVRHIGGRFDMLETIREFASECLALMDDGKQMAVRHAAYFTDLATQADEHIVGPQQEHWWQRLTEEKENMRAALGWAASGGSPEIGLRLSSLLWRYWWQRGDYREGKSWYEAALAIAADEPEELRAQGWSGLGSMLLGLGDFEPAIDLFERSLVVYEQHADYARTVATLTDMGIAHTGQERLDEARTSFEKALTLTRAAGDVRRTAVNLLNLADLAMLAGDLDEAAVLVEQGYEKMLEVGDGQSTGNALGNWALVELLRNNLDAVAALLVQALKRMRQTDDRYSILHALITAAGFFAATGQHHTAAAILGRTDALQREMEIAVNPTEQRLRKDTAVRIGAALSPAQLEHALAVGRGLEHETALDLIAEALEGNLDRLRAKVSIGPEDSQPG